MRVRIDRDGGIRCEACWTACPQVFGQNAADGWSEIIARFRIGSDLGLGEVGDDLRECVREAADGCPLEIIHVE